MENTATIEDLEIFTERAANEYLSIVQAQRIAYRARQLADKSKKRARQTFFSLLTLLAVIGGGATVIKASYSDPPYHEQERVLARDKEYKGSLCTEPVRPSYKNLVPSCTKSLDSILTESPKEPEIKHKPKSTVTKTKTAHKKPPVKNIYTRIVGQWEGVVEPVAKEFGIDPCLVYAVIYAESEGHHYLGKGKKRRINKSEAGAIGAMQLMPGTARALGVDARDPQENIRGGVKYMAGNLRNYNGDMELTIAAYNAGPGSVRKYNGIPPFRETQAYVPKVIKAYNLFKKLPK